MTDGHFRIKSVISQSQQWRDVDGVMNQSNPSDSVTFKKIKIKKYDICFHLALYCRLFTHSKVWVNLVFSRILKKTETPYPWYNAPKQKTHTCKYTHIPQGRPTRCAHHPLHSTAWQWSMHLLYYDGLMLWLLCAHTWVSKSQRGRIKSEMKKKWEIYRGRWKEGGKGEPIH